jgi:uncharacterized membrane protein
MAYYLKLYLATLIIFLTVDLVWLGLVARPFYEQQLGVLLVPTPNWVAALAFYLLFNVGRQRGRRRPEIPAPAARRRCRPA